MIRKFECLKCKNVFEADDQKMVKCPKCQSDNVEIAHFHLPKNWWKWALAVFVLIGIVIAVTTIVKPKVEESPIDNRPIVTVQDTSEIGKDTSEIEEDTFGIVLPIIVEDPSIKVDKPVYVNNGYSLSFKVEHAPNTKYNVVLLEYGGNKEIARSSDGKSFSGVPYSQKDGMYEIAIRLVVNDSLLSRLLVVGFDNQAPISEKMTKEQLQAAIDDDTADLTASNNQIATDCKLHYFGLPAGEAGPRTLSDLQMEIGIIWSMAKVTDVKYDKNNRISDITIELQKK